MMIAIPTPIQMTGAGGRKTDPKPEIEAIRSRNADCNENLVPLCRMMRAWKSEWNLSMGGLLVDTLAYQFIDDWKYKDESFFYYDYMCRDFFLFMADQDKDQEYWRAPGEVDNMYTRKMTSNTRQEDVITSR